MSQPRDRAPTRLDEISKDDREINKRLKNFDRISKEELPDVEIGTFIRYIRYKDKQWKFRTGGILSFNGYPEYFCIKFRMKNGIWKPHNVNITDDVIFYRKKKVDYDEKEIKSLLQALQTGYLKLIRSQDLKKLTDVYDRVQKHNGKDKIPMLFHTTDLDQESESEEDDVCTERQRVDTIVCLLQSDDEFSTSSSE